MKDNKRKKRIWIVLAACILFVLAADLIATKLVYDGIFVRYDAPAAEESSRTAGRYPEYSFVCGGNTLRGRLFYPEDANGALVVLSPGLHSGYEDMIPQILGMNGLGYAVFAFDPTGCRSSGGESAVGFPQGTRDLEACLDFVEEQGLFGCSSLLIFGHSRGGFSACAALQGGHDIAGIVSVSAPNSAMDAVLAPAARAAGTAAANANRPMLWLYQTMLFGRREVGVKADECVKNDETKTPVLVIIGSGDGTYTEERFSLYSELKGRPAENVRLLVLEGGHTDLMFDGEGNASSEFMDAVSGFFDECVTAGLSG